MAPANPNEPYFLLNEFLAHDKQYIDEILHKIGEKPQRWQENAIFLRNFTDEIYKAYCRQRTRMQAEILRNQQEATRLQKKQHDELLARKNALLQRITTLKEPSTPETPATPPQATLSSGPYGKLTPFLNDASISEIICAGARQPLVLMQNNQETPTTIKFDSDEELNAFIQTIAKKLNQTISPENPFLNAQLDEHTRIQANMTTPFLKAKFVIVKD